MPYVFRDDLTQADAAFEAWGRDKEELFISAWRALFWVMVESDQPQEKKARKTITLENTSLPLLLVDFLNEALFFKDAEALFLTVEALSIHEADGIFRLQAQLTGEPFDRSKHSLGTDVKAVTLHRFSLKKTAAGYTATVVLDV